MKSSIWDYIDLEKLNELLEGFNKSTGFVTAILDLEGNVLFKSGWRHICTEFHRVNPKTSENCRFSDTVLAGKVPEGEKYHFYKCLNGLVDVAVPVIIDGEHIANLFSGQFFFEKPDIEWFRNHSARYGFDEKSYLTALSEVPVVSIEKVKAAMDFLLEMTKLISEIAFQKNELKTSEQKYRSFFENSMDAILMTSPDGSILSANPSACQMFGRTESELRELGRAGVVDKTDPRLPALLKEREMNGKAKGELSFMRKDGSRFSAELTSAIFTDSSGKQKTSMIIRDITGRKEAEEALRLSEQKFFLAFHRSPDAITITKTSTGLFVEVNEGLERLSGYSRQEVIGKTSAELNLWANPEDRDRYMSIISKHGAVKDFETTFRIKSGEIRNYLLSGELFEMNGENHILGIVRDITLNKKLESGKRESEEKFRSVFEAANIGMSMTLPSGEINVNSAFCKILGYTADELKGRNWKELTPSEEIPMIEKNLAPLLNGEKDSARFEKRYIHSNGSFVWTDVSVVMYRDQKKTPLYFITSVIDISDKKKAFELQSNLSKILEDSVNEIYIFSLHDLRYLNINRGARNNTGYTLKEFLTMSPLDLKPEFTYDSFRDMIRPLISKENDRITFHALHRRKDGTTYKAEELLQIQQYYGEDVFVAFINDISGLKEVEELFTKAFHLGPTAKSITRISDGKFIDVNEAFLRIFGFNREEVIGKTSTELKMWSIEERQEIIRRQISSGGLTNSELTVTSKSGKHITVLFSSNPIDIGNNECLITAMVDISDRKRAETELKISEERIRLATLQSGVAVWEFDMLKNSMSRSANHDRLYGLVQQQVWKFETFLNATHPDDREYSNEIIQRSVIPGGPDNYRFDFRVIHPDGSVHWLEVAGRVIERDASGNGLIVRGTLADITDRINYEQELVKSKNELRRLALHIEEVRESERKAIALNLHDDLGQRMTALKIDLNWIKTQYGLNSQKALSKLKGMNDLIDDSILTIQKISSELRPTILYDLGLKDSIEWKIKEFSGSTGMKGSVSFDPESFVLDERLSVTIFRIIQEALTNVARHSAATTVSLEVKITQTTAEVTIQDNGKGISESSLNSTDSFGLIGMKERAEASGGSLSITGAEGKGTTVRLLIPVNQT